MELFKSLVSVGQRWSFRENDQRNHVAPMAYVLWSAGQAKTSLKVCRHGAHRSMTDLLTIVATAYHNKPSLVILQE